MQKLGMKPVPGVTRKWADPGVLLVEGTSIVFSSSVLKFTDLSNHAAAWALQVSPSRRARTWVQGHTAMESCRGALVAAWASAHSHPAHRVQ